MNIPFSTLQARMKKHSYINPSLGRHPVFSDQTENKMAQEIKYLANIFYGCTAIQIRKMAYQYAEKHGIKHNFKNESQMAGRDWLHGFLLRNNISVRKPEATSINRITAFNETEVHTFYQLLEELMVKYRFLPKNIYNCDETGISTVQDPGKILAAKEQKRVGSITSWERGKNITVVCAMSASGGFIPPMFIFPRKRMTPLLEKDGPVGALYKCSDNGWINETLFIQWLQHFTFHAKPSADEPVFLILDNHSSHISLSACKHCKDNHIVMLSLPPHTSHRMQPLDITFFGPLKAAYKKECDLFMKTHLAEKITPYEVASLFQKAFSKVASISKGESGFRTAGIFPLNPNNFTDEDFLPATILQSEPVVVETTSKSFQELSTASTSMQLDAIPSTSQPDTPLNTLPEVRDLLPIPTKTTLKTRKGRQKQHATILTLSPNIKNLIEKENLKGTKNKRKKNKGKGKQNKIEKKGVEKAKRQVLQDKNETSEPDVNSADLCDDHDDDDMKNARNRCIFCNEFGRDNEMWYRCTSCGLWTHSECSGWDSADDYICDNCLML